MDHPEYLYLLLRAHEVRKLAARAMEEGEEFHTADAFTPLASGLEAHAVIRPIQPDGPDALILRLRHADDGVDRAELVGRAQHAFFPATYVRVPSRLRAHGRCEYLAYTSAVPDLPAT